MIKKIIRNLLRVSIPESIHEKVASREKKNRLFDFKKKLVKDVWLKENKGIHKGERCFILATGPSLNKLDLSKIKNEYTIGVNGIYKIAYEINLNYFIYVSNWYWKNHVEGIRSLQCNRRFLPAGLKNELNSDVSTSWINVLRPKYYTKFGYPLKVPPFFSKQPDDFFVAGGTVIFLALQLAYHLGFKEVVILGLDHTYRKNDYKNKKHGGYRYRTDKEDNAHFDRNYNPKGIFVPIDLQAMENSYIISKEIFKADNRNILNASPGTMLDTFEKIDYDKLF